MFNFKGPPAGYRPYRNRVRKKVKILSLVLLVAVAACKKKATNQTQQVANNCVYSNAANTQVNFAILAGSSQFFPLNNIGGSIYVSGYGIKGIVIYRISQTQFAAFERSCTYDGCSNSKAIVWTHNSGVALRDSICGSVYNISDGTLQQGPATVQLYQYHTSWDGNQLQVYN